MVNINNLHSLYITNETAIVETILKKLGDVIAEYGLKIMQEIQKL